jgi:hypothetical protein
MVGLSIAGIAAPAFMDMSLAPFVAQRRASNFGIAEATAVSYAAKNEGGVTLTPAPDNCTVVPLETQSYSITCIEGDKSYRQSATRSFRLAVLTDGSDDSSGYSAPVAYTPGVFCPLWDAWGVINYNDSHNVQCIPVPYGPWASTYNGEMLW